MQQGTGGFRLVVRRGPQPNQVYELNKDVVALGRDITNDIVINDPEVSRHHCRMTRTPTGYILEDLGSTNGTFVNGQRLTGSRTLVNGDMIGLGETVTLGYEGGAVQRPASPFQQETVISSTAPPPYGAPGAPPSPAPPPGYQPIQQPYGEPQYQMPAQPYAQQPPPGYEYYEYEEEERNVGRWVAIGCGCLVVVCIIVLAVAAFIIDTLNIWCSVPLVPDLFNLNCNPALLLPLVLPFM